MPYHLRSNKRKKNSPPIQPPTSKRYSTISFRNSKSYQSQSQNLKMADIPDTINDQSMTSVTEGVTGQNQNNPTIPPNGGAQTEVPFVENNVHRLLGEVTPQNQNLNNSTSEPSFDGFDPTAPNASAMAREILGIPDPSRTSVPNSIPQNYHNPPPVYNSNPNIQIPPHARHTGAIPRNTFTSVAGQMPPAYSFPAMSHFAQVPIPPTYPFLTPPLQSVNNNETNRLLNALLEKMDRNFNEMRNMSQSNKNPVQINHPPVQETPQNTASNHNNVPGNNNLDGHNQQNEYINELEQRVSTLSDQVVSLMARMNLTNLNTSSPFQPSTYRVHPHKWNVRFGVKSKIPVDTFLFQITTLKDANDVTWENVLSNFHLFLEGNTLTWYWRFRLAASSDFSWEVLREALISKYRSKKTDEEIWLDMGQRKQGEKEKFQDFYDAIEDIHILCQTPRSDKVLMKLLSTNVKLATQKILITYKTDNLEEFIQTCIEIDKLLYPYLYQTNSNLYRRAAEIKSTEVSLASNEAMASKSCRNCGKFDHFVKECDQPMQISCFKCGKRGFTIKTCPDCNQNFRMNEELEEPPPSAPTMED